MSTPNVAAAADGLPPHSGVSEPDPCVASESPAVAVTSSGGKQAPKHIHRQMTRHVVTRWYRPPEIILTQVPVYTPSFIPYLGGFLVIVDCA